MKSAIVRVVSRVGAALVILGIISACTETRYVDYGKGIKEEQFPVKMVAYEISPAFYERFPTCVLILAPGPKDRITDELSQIVEAALTRHVMRRFDRVIDGVQRKNNVERYNLDLGYPEDRRAILKRLKCDTYIQTEILDPRIDYLLVWSQVGVGLEVQLRRSSDDQLLWRARHKARRSEGGLSLSPIGILADTVFSSRFAADREVAESLADDAVRRMIFPLPNTRTF